MTSKAPISSMREAGLLEGLLGRRDRAGAHHLGLDAHVGVGHQPHPDRQSELASGLLVGEQRGGRAVVDARGVAGGHLAVRAERRLERGQRLHRGAGSHRLVGRGQAPAELGRPGGHGDQVGLDLAGVVRRSRLLLRAHGVGVDALLGDRGVAVVEVLGRLAHHERVRVDDPLGQDPRVGVDALAHRVAAHVLDAAGDGDVVRSRRRCRTRSWSRRSSRRRTSGRSRSQARSAAGRPGGRRCGRWSGPGRRSGWWRRPRPRRPARAAGTGCGASAHGCT